MNSQESAFVWTGVHMLADHRQKKKKRDNQYFFTGPGDSEVLLNAITTCFGALSVP